ncbi:hypothetical protein ACN38_g7399 [Penicillium nordicum]|uniref:Uncharacterized protein n=1 Tax=Penicillium nordicum TaxID=229535 RepID=A0A0M9WEF7_9EURO|nr:hypothetical protein ACN38_g7399 [Penicillium nordicum]
MEADLRFSGLSGTLYTTYGRPKRPSKHNSLIRCYRHITLSLVYIASSNLDPLIKSELNLKKIGRSLGR